MKRSMVIMIMVVLSLTLCMASSSSGQTSQQVNICRSLIHSQGNKLHDVARRAIKNCVKQHSLAERGKISFKEAAAGCERRLQNVASAQVKVTKALNASVDCTSAVVAKMGSAQNWVENTIQQARQRALASAQAAIKAATIMQKLSRIEGGTACPHCGEFLDGGPCFQTNCVLGVSGSNMCLDTRDLDLSVQMAGVVSMTVCNSPELSPDYIVFGDIQKGIPPIEVGAVHLCLETLSIEGYIGRCSGSELGAVDYTACVDHRVSGGDTNECPGAPEACEASSEDTECRDSLGESCSEIDRAHLGVTNGGLCRTEITGLPTPGEGYLLTQTRFTVVYQGQKGPDGLPCTSDDTALAIPLTFPLTTRSATGRIYDADNRDGYVLPDGISLCQEALYGRPFDCAQVDAGILTGGKLVGVLPSLHAFLGPPRLDTIFTFEFDCQ
jgi:hypothetical protein